MRIPNPTKLLPRPNDLYSLTRRVAGLLPKLPGRSDAPAAGPVAPPKPEPVRPPEKPARPKARAKRAKASKAQKPKPTAEEPGDVSGDRDPHHALNNPVGEPDPTAWPDPYDEDPPDLDPHPAEDPDAQAQEEKVKRDKLDQ